MKQIFDWLREQIEELLKPDIECFECEEDFEFELKRHNKYLEVINEAEAKWESEVCEWKFFKPSNSLYENHGDFRTDDELAKWNVCPFCGKRIKISEVE